MKQPGIRCRIEAHCPLRPSEDPDKVRQSLSNILPNSMISSSDSLLSAKTDDLSALEKIYETIRSRSSLRSYRRQLRNNSRDDSTWIYLNRQAALADTVALCTDQDESPLGPIKLVIRSSDIEGIIDWLAPYGP